jgi:hypothetical protein
VAVNLVLTIAPATTIDAALSLGVIRYVNLVAGRERLLAIARREQGGGPEAAAKSGFDQKPDGTKVYRFQGDDGLRSLMQTLRAEQLKGGQKGV